MKNKIAVISILIVMIIVISLVCFQNKSIPFGDFGPLSIPRSWEVFKGEEGNILCKGKDNEGNETIMMVELIYLFEDGNDLFIDTSSNKKYTLEYLEGINLNNLATLYRVRIGYIGQFEERYILQLYTKENGIVDIKVLLFDRSVDVEIIREIGKSY